MDATGFIWLFIVNPAIGCAIGAWKGRPILGAVLGFFLAFVGWFIALILPKTLEKKAEEHARIRNILGD